MTRNLDGFTIGELMGELKSREVVKGKAPRAVSLETSELQRFDDKEIVIALKSQEKVIYGVDNRVDLFQLPPGPNLNDADSVVALFESKDVVGNGDGTSTLRTSNFGEEFGLCPNEPFRNQPTGAFGSGFLVAPDIIATAGHCVDTGNVKNVRFVFGFRMRNETTAEVIVNSGEIYSGVEVIGRKQEAKGSDWCLVRIDRRVGNHRIARIRQTGRIEGTQAVHVIGHPCGLPTKFADGAVVRDNQSDTFFIANLDTYGGNSGSPVFNSSTHEVEGILVRGDTDFVKQGNCYVSHICPTSGCQGEDCTRTTEFAKLVG